MHRLLVAVWMAFPDVLNVWLWLTGARVKPLYTSLQSRVIVHLSTKTARGPRLSSRGKVEWTGVRAPTHGVEGGHRLAHVLDAARTPRL